ncbi:MAG: mechanosensitive ion channel [Clostridium sp.]|jgi:small conductance mechanosensitive channel|nr:mechanosensitive ion channel [Clostridium sp.]
MEKYLYLFIDYVASVGLSVGMKVLYSAIILIVGLKLIGFFVKFITNSKGFQKIDSTVQSFIKSFTSIGLKVLLLIIVASTLGVELTSVMALLASAGLAVGLALQGALSNIAGGLIILIFKPFRVGDYIETQSLSGTVKEITVFYTILATPDNKRITLPNGSMTNASITNFSVEETRRVDLTFSAPYSVDIELVKNILLKLAENHPMVLKEPKPMSRLASHGDSALEYRLRVWCNNADYWTVLYDLTEGVKKEFDQQGIIIPYRQIDVHVLDKA